MTTYVDISNVDKIELLKHLWLNSTNASFFNTRSISNSLDWDTETDENAKIAINKYIDYFNGRCIKCDISGDVVNSSLYDRDFGNGKFKSIVDELKKVDELKN